MVRRISKLFGWPIDKDWIVNYGKSHGYDYGIMEGLTAGCAIDILAQESGVKGMMALHCKDDQKRKILILAIYADTDCWYDVDSETLIKPKHKEEDIQKLLKIIGKEGESPRWWRYEN